MREIIRQSVISLNFANSRGEKQIKARTFEVPGAGGFLLTEYAPGLERFYRIGEEIDTFITMESLEAKIRDYLGQRHRRDAIAQRGFERTRAEHTYDVRLREVLAAALAAKTEWEGAPHAVAPLALDSAFQRHRIGTLHRVLRAILIGAAAFATGPRRARRAARRFLFEISWRFAGQKTYMAAGLPGRLFPKD
jgi:spore maturation protein CgeB